MAENLSIGLSTLAHASAVEHLLPKDRAPGSADVGQQGTPATVWITAPDDVRRGGWHKVALEVAHTVDPMGRRLHRRVRHPSSVRLSALRRPVSSAADRSHRRSTRTPVPPPQTERM
jgi:hypothetical protein